MKKKLYIAADHAGFKLKEKLKPLLAKHGFEIVDLGAKKLEKNDDYPKFAFLLAKKVSKEKDQKGVLVCGSSFGVCIAANKVKNVRAVSPATLSDTKLTREHNNANVLCLPGWKMSAGSALKMIKVFIETSFSKERRHTRRVGQITKFEKKNFK